MIEIKETENINIGPEDQPGGAEPHKELLVWNKENIEEYLKECPKDEKENIIVPDEFFDQYYKILPDKIVNVSGTWRTTPSGGKLKILGGDPETDRAIHKAGGEALQASLKQRRTMAEDLKLLLAQKARPETIEALGLEAGATNQEAMIAAMFGQAADGNVKAGQFIRDTIGEQPTNKTEIQADIMTDHDRDLIEKLQKKLENK
jgi:hypothetical protein